MAPSLLPEITLPSSPLVLGQPLGQSASAPGLRDGPQRSKGSTASRAAFLERQQNHPAIEKRKSISTLHKQLLKDGRSADDVEFWGSRGKEGFKTYLEKKFGSILHGWRALDKDQNGRLSHKEFVNGCRAMGYHGNFKLLWGELDKNGNNFVSLMEIDEEVGHYIGTFKLELMKKHGDMLTAWKKGVDTNGTGRIEEKEIVAALQNLGLTQLDPKRLFGMLRSGPKGLGVTLLDFDPHSHTRYVSGDHQGLTLKANKEFLEDVVADVEDLPEDVTRHAEGGMNGGAREFRRQQVKLSRQEQQDELEKLKAFKAGLHTVEGFKKALTIRCGSLLSAWRTGLDLDGNGRLTHGEFCVALQRLGLFGDVKGLWKELCKSVDKKDLDKGAGFLVFADLDPEIDAQLHELHTKLEQMYGNLLLAWVKVFDTKGTGLVNEDQFMKACVGAGFSKDARALFHIVKPGKEKVYLTLKDFDRKAYLAHSRGDFRMLSEQERPTYGKKALEMSFDERKEAGFFFQVRKSWEASHRDEFKKACRADVKEHQIDTPEQFEDLCLRKFGSMAAAWRTCLDADGNGKLTFGEFCKGLRRLGFAGEFKELWKHYDCDKNGHISLMELDKPAHERINSFLTLLNEKYGDLDTAWKFGFGKDTHGSLDRAELREACKALAYPHNTDQLFVDLMPMPGRLLLTIWDIDPECTRQRARGHKAVIGGNVAKERAASASVPALSQDLGAGTATSSSFASRGGGTKTSSILPTGGGNPNNPGDVAYAPRKQLKNLLKVNYGSTAAAWRNEIDPRWQGSVHLGKFLIVMEHIQFNGNVKKLWEELTEGRPSATFADIDPEAYKVLVKFRRTLLEKFGCLSKSWQEGLDVDRLGRLDFSEFSASCEALEINDKMAKRVFQLMLARPGQRSLVCEDLQMLLIGVPTEHMAIVWAGAPGDTADDDGADGATSSPLLSPAAAMGKVVVQMASPRQHAEKCLATFHGKDIVIKSVDGFKQMCVVKYGSLWSAWRHSLDVDGNGRMTQVDFAKACQFLGVKAVQKLWSEIDTRALGFITLSEIDPEVSELFAELEKLLLEKFSSSKEGWRKIFDPDNSLRCDMPAFGAGCVTLGFRGKGKNCNERFFKLLRPEPGRSYLTYDDLWIDKDPNEFKSATSA